MVVTKGYHTMCAKVVELGLRMVGLEPTKSGEIDRLGIGCVYQFRHTRIKGLRPNIGDV